VVLRPVSVVKNGLGEKEDSYFLCLVCSIYVSQVWLVFCSQFMLWVSLDTMKHD